MVNASTEQFTIMVQRCRETSAQLTEGMARVLSRVEGLGGHGFAGGANLALQAVIVDLVRSQTTVVEALDEMADRLEEIARLHAAADADAAIGDAMRTRTAER